LNVNIDVMCELAPKGSHVVVELPAGAAANVQRGDQLELAERSNGVME